MAAKKDRVPPHSLEAEVAVLGGILLEPAALDEVADVEPGDFYAQKHRLVYEAVLSLRKRGDPCDMIIITEELKSHGRLAEAGGAAYVSELTDRAVTSANIAYHARIVQDRARKRRLISSCTEILLKAYDGAEPAEELLDRAEAAVMAVARRRDARDLMAVGDLIPAFFEQVEKAYERGGHLVGRSSGFADLDSLTCGLEPEDMIVLGARPGMGKSAFAGALALEVADQGSAVAVFSLEMSNEQVLQRLVASRAGISLVRLRSGRLSAQEFPELAKASGSLSKLPIYLDDSPAINPLSLRAKARRLHKRSPLGLIVVDYVQLMTGSGDNREQEVSDCSRSLKQLAKELRCPVVVLAQLSREVERRNPPIPRPSDLRESGSLEADADKIIFLYRPAMWSERHRKEKPREAKAFVAKNRNGPTGTALLDFDPETATFHNATTAEEFAPGNGAEPPPEHWSER